MGSTSDLLTQAIAHHQAGRTREAEAVCRQLLAFDPGASGAWHMLGLLEYQQGRFEAAANSFLRALQLNPSFAEAHNNLGIVLQVLDRTNESLACYEQALRLKPDFANAYNNMGIAYRQQGRLDEAEACFNRAIAADPEIAEAHLSRSTLWLLRGDYERGWPEHEWLWKTRLYDFYDYKGPKWQGEDLQGRTILLHAELGFGDTFHFIRYAPKVKRLGASVVLECQKPLIKVVASCPGIDQLIARGEEPCPYDFHSPLFSLPVILKSRLDTIPADVPYVFADPALVTSWCEILRTINGFRVGVNWCGGSGPGIFSQRDFPLECLANLAHVPGVRLISLQKGGGDSPALRSSIIDLGGELDTSHGAFMDTAAIMMNLDLVITSDTSVAHLAGALGVPVWVALPLVPYWRWMLDRSDSPWYPTMRLFRQKTRGDWAGVFADIQAALWERLKR